jgi:allantoinase
MDRGCATVRGRSATNSSRGVGSRRRLRHRSEVHQRLALTSTRVVTGDAPKHATVVVDGERIADVRDGSSVRDGETHIDLGDDMLAPGLVDSHVHVNEPGRTDWEGFSTATQAAAAGGVTTIVDMPLNCIPVTTTARALAIKLVAARPQMWIDVGFWGGVVPGNADELEPLAQAGVLGCKAFMVHSGIDEFPDSDLETLRTAMQRLRAANIPLLAHAELDLGADIEGADPRRYDTYLRSRPCAWEDAAIARLILLCRETGCAVHVVHLSSADSLPQIRAAKAEGLPLTVETCAHYLCLRAEDVPDGATGFKCAPPIRDDDNRTRLWQGLVDGDIDFVVTDHSPCTPHLKGTSGDFMSAWGGIASLQLGLPSVWTEARARGIAPARVIEWMSRRPAVFAGLGDRKGRIAPGYDADLIAWSPEQSVRVTPESLRFRHKQSPYVGRDLWGEVHRTWLRGTLVYDAGRMTSAPHGRALLGRNARN